VFVVHNVAWSTDIPVPRGDRTAARERSRTRDRTAGPEATGPGTARQALERTPDPRPHSEAGPHRFGAGPLLSATC